VRLTSGGDKALILATAGLAWAVLAERMMTRREASYAILIAATFAADWLTLYHSLAYRMPFLRKRR